MPLTTALNVYVEVLGTEEFAQILKVLVSVLELKSAGERTVKPGSVFTIEEVSALAPE